MCFGPRSPDLQRTPRTAACRWLENVPGIRTWRGGVAMREIEAAYRAAGFTHVSWTTLDAADFGVAQRRKRIFVVGFRDAGAFSWPLPTHGRSYWARRPWVSVREAFGLEGDYLKGRMPGASGWAGQRYIDVDGPTTTTTCKTNTDILARPSPTISAGGGGGGGGPEPLANAKAREALGDALAEAGLASRPATAVQAHATGRLAKAGHHARQFNGAVRLTVEQCARLQDLPEHWDWSWMTKTAAHRCIGNAVPPTLGEAVGRQVRKALEGAQRGAA